MMPPSRINPERKAFVSECGRYRYWLTRRWSAGPIGTIVMLNPSTADAEVDDPTIIRVMRFFAREGCGAVGVVNLFAFRATDPRELLAANDPVGALNDEHIELAASVSAGQDAPIVVAWGAGVPKGSNRPDQVVELLRPHAARLRCFGYTAKGLPRHPLMLKLETPLVPYTHTPGDVR